MKLHVHTDVARLGATCKTRGYRARDGDCPDAAGMVLTVEPDYVPAARRTAPASCAGWRAHRGRWGGEGVLDPASPGTPTRRAPRRLGRVAGAPKDISTRRRGGATAAPPRLRGFTSAHARRVHLGGERVAGVARPRVVARVRGEGAARPRAGGARAAHRVGARALREAAHRAAARVRLAGGEALHAERFGSASPFFRSLSFRRRARRLRSHARGKPAMSPGRRDGPLGAGLRLGSSVGRVVARSMVTARCRSRLGRLPGRCPGSCPRRGEQVVVVPRTVRRPAAAASSRTSTAQAVPGPASASCPSLPPCCGSGERRGRAPAGTRPPPRYHAAVRQSNVLFTGMACSRWSACAGGLARVAGVGDLAALVVGVVARVQRVVAVAAPVVPSCHSAVRAGQSGSRAAWPGTRACPCTVPGRRRRRCLE